MIKIKYKKAQIAGQVFIYILALIIFSAVLIYGYKAVKTFGEQSEGLIITQLTNEIKTQVGKIESQYGSVEKLQLEIPERFEKVCFVDTRDKCISFSQITSSDSNRIENIHSEYPLIYDAWKDCTGENMFLMKGVSAEGYNIGSLQVQDGFFCVDVAIPKTVLRLRGTGEYAEISAW
ncbi:MAG: hypothetical protein KAS15_05325 [Nanoarchaeota archaeon]|nr:hypothetical protein [Nanoarchaeota archaeon]